jgi:hypothetical protein
MPRGAREDRRPICDMTRSPYTHIPAATHQNSFSVPQSVVHDELWQKVIVRGPHTVQLPTQIDALCCTYVRLITEHRSFEFKILEMLYCIMDCNRTFKFSTKFSTKTPQTLQEVFCCGVCVDILCRSNLPLIKQRSCPFFL